MFRALNNRQGVTLWKHWEKLINLMEMSENLGPEEIAAQNQANVEHVRDALFKIARDDVWDGLRSAAGSLDKEALKRKIYNFKVAGSESMPDMDAWEAIETAQRKNFNKPGYLTSVSRYLIFLTALAKSRAFTKEHSKDTAFKEGMALLISRLKEIQSNLNGGNTYTGPQSGVREKAVREHLFYVDHVIQALENLLTECSPESVRAREQADEDALRAIRNGTRKKAKRNLRF